MGTFGDPILAPLEDNGGPTQTLALQAGSAAINAGDNAICAAPPASSLDQRGFVRPGPFAANCSIGAYEFNSGVACGARLCAFPQICLSGQCVALTPTFTSPPATPTSTATPTPTSMPIPCVGDCSNDGQVTVDELVTLVNIALGNTTVSSCTPGAANPDDESTIDEILMAVNNALSGCALTPEQNCLGSGGTVTSAMCCASTGDFPDTCGVGACGCSPDASHEVRFCDCGAGICFNGNACVSQ